MQVQIHGIEHGNMVLNRALEANPTGLSKQTWEAFLGWILTFLWGWTPCGMAER